MKLIEDLAQGYERWQNANCRRSIALLARLSEVHYQTLRRIVQREVGETRFETAMAMATVIFDRDELLTFANEHYGTAGKWLERWSYLARDRSPADTSSFFMQPAFLKLILLSDTQSGLDRETVKKKMGEDGLAHLNELLDASILSEQEGRIRLAEYFRRPGALPGSFTQLYTLLQLLEFHQSESIYRRLQFSLHSGLNEEGMILLQKTLIKIQEEALAIYNDPLLKGDIPSVFLAAHGVVPWG